MLQMDVQMQRYSCSILHFHCQQRHQCKTNKVSEMYLNRVLLPGILKKKKKDQHIYRL